MPRGLHLGGTVLPAAVCWALLPSAPLAQPAAFKTIAVGNGPHGVVVSTDVHRVYVTNGFSDTVSEIDVATQAVQRTFRVGDEPTGVTYAAGTTAP